MVVNFFKAVLLVFLPVFRWYNVDYLKPLLDFLALNAIIYLYADFQIFLLVASSLSGTCFLWISHLRSESFNNPERNWEIQRKQVPEREEATKTNEYNPFLISIDNIVKNILMVYR